MPPKNGMRPVHPGEVLREELRTLDLSANALSKALDVPVNRITAILNGQRGVTADTALRLARYFGTTPQVWLNLQQTYDLRRAEIAVGERIAECVRPRNTEVAPVSWTPILLGGEGVSAMPKTRPPYAAEFRQQMVDLVRSGRAPEDLAREFEPSSQAIRTWVAQAGRDAGERSDGLRTEEREELRRLRRENRRLCEEREILAKATAWFAREARPGRPTGS